MAVAVAATGAGATTAARAGAAGAVDIAQRETTRTRPTLATAAGGATRGD